MSQPPAQQVPEVHDDTPPRARAIAFYLPQFHPIPENDAWWGRGFTEWTNVTKAQPQFRGHDQPHLPADLGFYDLRLSEAREAQADLARQYGISGFCYYHYWFNGRRLLERPFAEVLSSGTPDFSFCLCWANENWTRVWDGQNRQILVAQHYSADDDRAHAHHLMPAFQDQRYIRVKGKPLFLVYNAEQLPRPLETTAIWRSVAREHGIGDLYLCKVESIFDRRRDPIEMGFDAAVEFQPDIVRLGTWWRRKTWWAKHKVRWRKGLTVYDYAWLVDYMLRQPRPAYPYFPCVAPSWDNTARRIRGAFVLKNSTPEQYERWLRSAIAEVQPRDPEERIVFINAWNEWAEGCHLEPSLRWGRAYLEATKNVVFAPAHPK